MKGIRSLLQALRVRVMYLIALLLILLVPLIFISFGSGLITKVAKKIPLREGNFSGAGSVLDVDRAPGQR